MIELLFTSFSYKETLNQCYICKKTERKYKQII